MRACVPPFSSHNIYWTCSLHVHSLASELYPFKSNVVCVCIICGLLHDEGDVAVVLSHIQCMALAAEETKVAQRVSRRPIQYKSRLWLKRGTEVNGSHHVIRIIPLS